MTLSVSPIISSMAYVSSKLVNSLTVWSDPTYIFTLMHLKSLFIAGPEPGSCRALHKKCINHKAGRSSTSFVLHANEMAGRKLIIQIELNKSKTWDFIWSSRRLAHLATPLAISSWWRGDLSAMQYVQYFNTSKKQSFIGWITGNPLSWHVCPSHEVQSTTYFPSRSVILYSGGQSASGSIYIPVLTSTSNGRSTWAWTNSTNLNVVYRP